METNDIYELVNSINAQTMGAQAITAVDTASFIATGEAILASNDYTETFLNTLVQRINRTIISFRAYTSKLRDISLSDADWGAIVQKIKVVMPEMVQEVSYDLEDGESVDHYIVRKPQAKQKFFVIRTPYSDYITIQRKWLREAFLAESAMEEFIATVFGEIQNSIELSNENLNRLCLNNYIANVDPLDTVQAVHLLSRYNTLHGTSLTAEQALHDGAFLRDAIADIKLQSMYLTDMRVDYNKENFQRHTPLRDQRYILRSDFRIYMETQAQWAAFHQEYLEKSTDMTVNYWQSPTDIGTIKIKDDSGDTVTVEKVLGIIHDRDALGTFRKQEDVLTTPVNARGEYYNTFWHFNDARLNDFSENAVVFYLD